MPTELAPEQGDPGPGPPPAPTSASPAPAPARPIRMRKAITDDTAERPATLTSRSFAHAPAASYSANYSTAVPAPTGASVAEAPAPASAGAPAGGAPGGSISGPRRLCRAMSFDRHRANSTPATTAGVSGADAAVSAAPGGGGDGGGGGSRRLSRALSFERKVGQQRRGDGGAVGNRLQRSVSFGRKAKAGSASADGAGAARRGSTGSMQIVAEPEGKLQHEGFLWKRAALKFQKRWFFLQAGTLCYYDPLNPGSNAIVCGQLSSVIVTNVERLELTMFTDQRQYDFRCESTKELEGWKRASEKAIGAWLQS